MNGHMIIELSRSTLLRTHGLWSQAIYNRKLKMYSFHMYHLVAWGQQGHHAWHLCRSTLIYGLPSLRVYSMVSDSWKLDVTASHIHYIRSKLVHYAKALLECIQTQYINPCSIGNTAGCAEHPIQHTICTLEVQAMPYNTSNWLCCVRP